MQRAFTPSTRLALRTTTPSLHRTYAGIKQDDPSLHPTGANSEAAKAKGPLANSQPPTNSNPADQSSKSKSGTESNAAVQEKKENQQSRSQSQSQPSSGDRRRKTVAEMDEELKRKMSGHTGDGGEAGVEYENGQPVAMKRSVRNNMFRYI